MAAGIPDDFEKELVDLFVQEAHEWLQNIHVALDELQQGPAPERHAKLIGTISVGVTNLGGSAATLNLSDVERASFATIPFVEALRDPRKTFSLQDFLSLCKQLGQIHTALTRATGVSFEEDGSSAATEVADASLSPREFLQALQDLQEKQFSSTASGRNLIRSLIDQMEGQVRAGVEHIAAKAIQEYLTRVSEAEELFLKAIDERVPEISKKISTLEMDGEEACPIEAAVEASLQDIARLCAEAQQVNSGSAMMFFTGLHSLLTIVAQRRVRLTSTRVEAIKARIRVMVGAIRQWVEHGRAQRAAIDQLLPAGHS